MTRHLLTVAAAALASACGTVRHALTLPPTQAARAATEPGAPKPAAGLDWNFAPVGANAALTYGGGAGGAPRLMLACAQKSGAVTVGQPVAGDKPASPVLTLVSGTVRTTAVAAVQPWPSDPSQSVLSARFSTLDPILQSFRRRRTLGVPAGAEKVDNFVEQPASTAIEQFFAFCG